jgi:hypothetical protein
MADINVQFHALPSELAAIMMPPVANLNAHAATIGAFPFVARVVADSKLREAFLDEAVNSIVFSLQPMACDARTLGSFLDANPDVLILDIGRLSQRGLKESCLSARIPNGSSARRPWQKFVDALRAATSAGAVAVHPQTGGTSLRKTHRFTKSAKELESQGIAMLPTAGVTQLKFCDFQLDVPSRKHPSDS